MPRISQLPSLSTADNADEIAIVDVSASTTKKITRGDLLKAPLPTDSVTTAAIADGAVTADKIDFATYTGTVNISTTGNKTVTGIPFRPTYVEIIGTFNLTSVTARTSIGGFTDSEQWVALSSATATASLASQDTTRCLWAATAAAGTTEVSVTRSSITDDGFVLNVGTAQSAVITNLRYIAHR